MCKQKSLYENSDQGLEIQHLLTCTSENVPSHYYDGTKPKVNNEKMRGCFKRTGFKLRKVEALCFIKHATV